jgi:Parkin co-regulated protein
LDYDPLLINCVEGLLETDHPYAFVAYQSLTELLDAPGAADKTIPLVHKLIMPLRSAFLSSDPKIWSKGLETLRRLSETVGGHLTPHIHILLAQLNKRMTLNKKSREDVMRVLNTIEEKGGKEALEALRSKIPTYMSINM